MHTRFSHWNKDNCIGTGKVKSTIAQLRLSGDAGTPIADKLAKIEFAYFLIVVCAIYLEKYLVPITGLAAFKLLIPIGCILLYSGLPASTR